MDDTNQRAELSLAQCAMLATIIEATSPKPGNVHRGADFADLSYPDFLVAAVAAYPALDREVPLPLGQTVLACVRATKAAIGANVNLGSILLIVPLAAVPRDQALAAGIPGVLASLTRQDARDVYEAIRLANPGGMGTVPEADVQGPPPDDLIAAMRLAEDRDFVARQYANGFREVLGDVAPLLALGPSRGWTISQTVVHAHVQLLARYGDSLIARKAGQAVAQQAADRAAQALSAGGPGDEGYQAQLADLDFWLRSDGNVRNPGTTADLIAAGLFALLRDGIMKSPLRLAGGAGTFS